MERVETKQQNNIRVNVSALTRAETREAFGKKLDKALVQPVWVEIENNSGRPLWFMLHGIDPNYYSAREAAALVHRGAPGNRTEIDNYFDSMAIDPVVPDGGTVSGFVFSNLKLGTKEIRVHLLGRNTLEEFHFFVPVPGLRADWQRVDFNALYSSQEIEYLEQPAELIARLESFTCCTTKKKGNGSGDPVNLVVISPNSESLRALLRAGWDETEVISFSSSMRTAKSFLTGGEYKNSPISALYLFERPQDLSLQKARHTIHQRNHLRLWLTPWVYRGGNVWIGAISRDIGVKWTTRTWNLTTHAIDSEVDEARNYLIEDLAAAQGLSAYGFVEGVGPTTPEDNKTNLLGTPWWSDGFRAVLELTDGRVPLEDTRRLDWGKKILDHQAD